MVRYIANQAIVISAIADIRRNRRLLQEIYIADFEHRQTIAEGQAVARRRPKIRG